MEVIPLERFRIVTKQDQQKWDLPTEVVGYVNQNFNTFIPEKDINEVLANIQRSKNLGDYLIEILKGNKHSTVTFVTVTFGTDLQNRKDPLLSDQHYRKGFGPSNSIIPGCNLAQKFRNRSHSIKGTEIYQILEFIGKYFKTPSIRAIKTFC